MNHKNRCLFFLVLAISAVVFLVTSCALKSEGYPAEAMEGSADMAPSARSLGNALDSESSSAAVFEDKSAEPELPSEANAGERKRVYNGSAGLVVEDMEESRRELEKLAVDSGGYVESSYSDYLVLRVPAAQFDRIFEQILTLGRVEYHRVDTWDVTESYEDTRRRLDTASETRARLYELLEKSTDPKERALILREIGRLTEEIESLKQQLAVLDARIAYSQITVELIARLQADYSAEDIPFPWIANLDPLSPAGYSLRGRLSLDLGDHFAVFTKDDVFLAENSSGVNVSISTIPNEPRGDASFWQQALTFHIAPYYAETSALNLDFGGRGLYGVELLSKDRVPFRFFVGVMADGKQLHVVQIFSPDSQETFDNLYTAFEEGSLK